MKRAHRNMHFALWLILGPLILLVLVLAIMLRPEAAVNDDLPGVLIEETR